MLVKLVKRLIVNFKFKMFALLSDITHIDFYLEREGEMVIEFPKDVMRKKGRMGTFCPQRWWHDYGR